MILKNFRLEIAGSKRRGAVAPGFQSLLFSVPLLLPFQIVARKNIASDGLKYFTLSLFTGANDQSHESKKCDLPAG